jgi:hypothetical protein
MKDIPVKDLFLKTNKLRFVILSFIVLQILWTVIGIEKSVEFSPFYLYAMYSEPFKNQETYESWIVKVDGQQIDITELPYWEKEFLINPLNLYCRLQDTKKRPDLILKAGLKVPSKFVPYYMASLTNDRKALQNFPLWFKKYLMVALKRNIVRISVERGFYKYDTNGTVLFRTEKIFEI